MRVLLLVALVALGVTASAPAREDAPPRLDSFSVRSDTTAYAGDTKLLATISPNGDGYRDRALIRFRLNEPASVEVAIAALGFRARTVFDRTLRARAGWHVVAWEPRAWIPPRTYVVRFTARDRSGNVRRYGLATRARTPIIRVLGIEAAFERESYRPNQAAALRLASDEQLLALQVVRVGGRRALTPGNDGLNAEAVMEAIPIRRLDRRDRPRRLRLWVGDWRGGLYFAKLTAPDGRSGYAPFIVRPSRLGEHRVAVVLPTYTWQAYNLRDEDRDGFGDTWYASRSRRTLLGRPFMDRGVPPFFRAYDRGFLVWLARGARQGKDRAVDFLTDSDLDAIGGGVRLARAYDLIIFPGHHEYVTRREFDAIRAFRDDGGNLMFLSANNFYWRVERRARTLIRVAKWRELGRPEASLIGVQYRASDRGQRKAPYVVVSTSRTPWLFGGTGLEVGSRFGRFGIEIDAKARSSPPNTFVVAEIRNLFGVDRTAQMTYYETRSNAKVFAAGAFTLGGYARYPPVAQLLDNLWSRLAVP